MNDPDPDVRQAALAAISGVKDPVVKEPIEKALDDPEEPVRDMALEVAADLGTRIRLEIYERNLHSEYDSVKIGTIEKLEDMGNPYAFEVLLDGLRDKSPKIRKFTNESIYFLVSENFKSYDEAKSWWDANRDRYDENLFEKE